MPQDRVDVDHHRAVALPQQRQGQANQFRRGEEIDLHDLPQPLGRSVGKCTHRAAAGVVDQQVEPAESLLGPLDRGLAHLGCRSRRRRAFEDLARCAGQRCGQRIEPLGPAANHEQASPLADQLIGQRAGQCRLTLRSECRDSLRSLDVPCGQVYRLRVRLAVGRWRRQTSSGWPLPFAVALPVAVRPCGRIVRVDRAQMAHRPLGNAAVHDHAAVGVALRQHFAVAGQQGQQAAVVDAGLDVHVEETVAQRLADRRGQLRRCPGPCGR